MVSNLGLFFLLFVSSAIAEIDPAFYSLKVSATASKTPSPRIVLNWPTELCTASYDCQHFTIFKSIYNHDSLSPAEPTLTQIAQVSKTTTSYVDTNVVVGTRYIYRLVRQNVQGFLPNTPENTLISGIEVPLIEYFGKVIFVVETAVVNSLSTLLQQAEDDMIGDGWGVVRIVVDRSYTVQQTKTLIRQTYQSNPDAKALYIFGSVPVAYSGVIAPDGHNDHRGAWPTDMYYADTIENGLWTDNTNFVNNNLERLSNRPGDGKFDQGSMPSGYIQELQVGRVDMTGITLLPDETEISLLQKYFIKSHNFKHGITKYRRRALIRDSFGERNGEAFAQNGWKPYNVIVGNNNIVKYIDNTIPNVLKNGSIEDYLFFYGCGGGNVEWMDGTGHIHDYLYWQPKWPFTMLFGSYFGDWAYNNVLLKAPIVGAHGLTSVWGARPNWIFYHLGLGYNIGRSSWASQSKQRAIHMSLLGDPTLRPFIVSPPSNFRASRSGNTVTLNWNASPETVVGYHVYSAPHKYGTFTRQTTNLVSGLSFSASLSSSSSAVFMVRAVKLDTTASGSFFNPSQGIFVNVGNPVAPPTTTPTPPPTTPPTPTPTPTTNPLCSILPLLC